MKTKTIFKTLALAMLLPAMLLTTACSSSNDDAIINNENINNENTAKKGFTIPVTVNVTRQGDATTRATYNGTTNQLSFSSGDQLFVWGSNNTAGSFAGKLKWQSGGTFSGTITTEKEYTGTADDLFSESDNYAVLLPNGYKTYGFLSAGDGYSSDLDYDYTKAFADSKAAAVEQFSCELTTTYDDGFALTPRNAILNFTITGLTASTSVNVVFTKGNLNIDKTVTTNESGTATFAIGVEDYSDLKDCTLTVGGNIISLVSSSKKLYAGSIYNITRSAAPAPTYTMAANATAEDYGKVVCNNGHLHPAKTAVPSGCTAVGILGKVTETGHGLILALEDATNQTWNTINGWTSVTTYASTTLKLLPDADARGSLTSYTTLGSTAVSNWAVAQKSDYEAIFKNLGSTTKGGNGYYTFDTKVNAYITDVGGTAMSAPSPSYYWSATEYTNNINGWVFFNEQWTANGKGGTEKVRPVLAF